MHGACPWTASEYCLSPCPEFFPQLRERESGWILDTQPRHRPAHSPLLLLFTLCIETLERKSDLHRLLNFSVNLSSSSSGLCAVFPLAVHYRSLSRPCGRISLLAALNRLLPCRPLPLCRPPPLLSVPFLTIFSRSSTSFPRSPSPSLDSNRSQPLSGPLSSLPGPRPPSRLSRVVPHVPPPIPPASSTLVER